ncbi:hypothetical protein GN958_ATG22195 [Phytophthora infestans]|uniref:Uncharacterized protein n=1 Tax=Phytophthora infestans TaxID=4787 RepID=A0A8S9TIB5_PHYIN|nr:hypothetical protein GN958_ATG22195 [Phytophthora infestans]
MSSGVSKRALATNNQSMPRHETTASQQKLDFSSGSQHRTSTKRDIVDRSKLFARDLMSRRGDDTVALQCKDTSCIAARKNIAMMREEDTDGATLRCFPV